MRSNRGEETTAERVDTLFWSKSGCGQRLCRRWAVFFVSLSYLMLPPRPDDPEWLRRPNNQVVKESLVRCSRLELVNQVS